MKVPSPDPTGLLTRVRPDDRSSVEAMLPLVYDELRQLAQWMMNGERREHTLSATALVHEAYLRLIDSSRVDCHDAAHFKAVAAGCLRRVLIDHVRAGSTQKRGGEHHRVTLDTRLMGEGAPGLDLVEFEDLLAVLAADSPRVAAIVELRVFGGLTIPETAQWLDCSTATVDRDWRFARAWLSGQLFGDPGDGATAGERR